MDRETQLKNKRICRFCLTVKGPLTNIYSNENRLKSRAPLPLQILACVSIEVWIKIISKKSKTNGSFPCAFIETACCSAHKREYYKVFSAWFAFMIIFRVPSPFQFEIIMCFLTINFVHQVFTNDGMPCTICDPCRLVMDYTYRFKQMCKKSETALKQFPLTGIWQEHVEHPVYPTDEMNIALQV